MKNHPLILLVASTFEEARAMSDLLPPECNIALVNSGADALIAARHQPQPDLIMLHYALPDMDGLELCRRLKRSIFTRGIAVVFAGTTENCMQEIQALDLLADDCIAYAQEPSVARARIRNRLQPRPIAPVSGITANNVGLGQRQTEVLSLIAEGLTSAEIGAQLSIAKGTVEVHRENIMRKLDVHNIAGLVKYAIRHGLAHT